MHLKVCMYKGCAHGGRGGSCLKRISCIKVSDRITLKYMYDMSLYSVQIKYMEYSYHKQVSKTSSVSFFLQRRFSRLVPVISRPAISVRRKTPPVARVRRGTNQLTGPPPTLFFFCDSTSHGFKSLGNKTKTKKQKKSLVFPKSLFMSVRTENRVCT